MIVERGNLKRIVAITAGLTAGGAVIGGLAGAATLAIRALSVGGPFAISDVSDPIPLSHHVLVCAMRGLGFAVIGSFAAPLAGWLVLRRVPLGQTFGGLALGTILGGLIGWDPLLMQPKTAAAIGFLVTALLMRTIYQPVH